MPIANMDIQILPSIDGGGEKEKYAVIDQVIAYIESTGLKYEVGGLGTTIEGEFNQLIEVLKRSQELCVEHGADRICTIAKFDYKVEGITIEEKVGKHRK